MGDFFAGVVKAIGASKEATKAQCSKSRNKVGQKFPQILSKTTWMSNKLAILASFLNICDQWDLTVKAGKIDFVSHEPNLLVKMKF